MIELKDVYDPDRPLLLDDIVNTKLHPNMYSMFYYMRYNELMEWYKNDHITKENKQ